MKTFIILIILFTFFLSPVISQQEKKNETTNGWYPFAFDTSGVNTYLSNDNEKNYQIFKEYNNTFKLNDIFGLQTTWIKDFLSYPKVPDTLKINTKYITGGINISELWIVIAMQDSNSYYYYEVKNLELNSKWKETEWDMSKMKKIMKNFGRLYLIFIVISSDSCYTGYDIGVDNLYGVDDTLGIVVYDTFGDPTRISENPKEIPTNFALSQNYPNPFNPSTTIKFSVSNLSFVNIKIYDILGKEVATLVNEEKPVGNYEVSFDASNLPSGTYFYRLQAGSFVETKKMLLLK